LLVPEGRGYALNRTEFYRALKSEYDSYLNELQDAAAVDLRLRFLEKMNDIVKEC
jgi:hypothetical protein